MIVFCSRCGAVGLADAQYELIRRGWRFVDPDDLESSGWCYDCSLAIGGDEWEHIRNICLGTDFFGE